MKKVIKNLLKWLLVVFICMISTMAIIRVDEKCSEMTSFGGDIEASAEVAIEKSGIFQ